MILDKYIRELLFREDCVIIPGMGGFISSYASAEIQEESQTFVPPTKEIGFNAELIADDGMLVSYMSVEMDRPKDVILEMITAQVEEILEILARGEKVNMEGIGQFSSGKGGALMFSAHLGINFLMDSFGLSTFTFPVLEAEKQSIFKRSIFFRQVVFHPRETLPGSIKKSHEKDHINQQFGIALAILVILSLLPFNSRISESIFRHPAALGPLPSLVIVDPPVELSGRGAITTLYQAEFINSDESPAMKYPIIAGSFQSGQNADLLYQKLISRGYNAKVEQTRKSFYRVIMAEFITLDKAELALLDLQAGNRDLKLWILK
ncbi:MAG: SPOR domain-containing protein [Bacteroidota bacterium]|nr:SPOR domain-containing protein [Bacteroidota bacterium]